MKEITADYIRKKQSKIILEEKAKKDVESKVQIILERVEDYATKYPHKKSIDLINDIDSYILNNPKVIQELRKLGFKVNLYSEEHRDVSGYNEYYHKVISWE